MNRYFYILLILILADRVAPEQQENLACFPLNYLRDNIGENVMFKTIPNYPNYQFNTETLDIKSLARITLRKDGRKLPVKEKHLFLTISDKGYCRISLYNEDGKKNFKRSQISWLVKYGSLPSEHLQIDHIDGNKLNDHIDNLQQLTKRENISKGFQQNGTKYNLPPGVSLHIQTKKYISQIWIDGKTKYLGLFKTITEASNAYQKEVTLLL